ARAEATLPEAGRVEAGGLDERQAEHVHAGQAEEDAHRRQVAPRVPRQVAADHARGPPQAVAQGGPETAVEADGLRRVLAQQVAGGVAGRRIRDAALRTE